MTSKDTVDANPAQPQYIILPELPRFKVGSCRNFSHPPCYVKVRCFRIYFGFRASEILRLPFQGSISGSPFREAHKLSKMVRGRHPCNALGYTHGFTPKP